MSADTAAVTTATLRKMKRSGEKFVCLTAYDASFARLLEEAGVEVLLVGDSLGMVVQGQDTTLPVSVADMIYHTRCVRRGAQRALVVVDMPFMSHASPVQALGNASRLMKEGGAQVVKLEGGAVMVDTVAHLSRHGIPVCAHLGLLPQTVHKLGGYRVQGKEQAAAEQILADARAMQEAGADLLLLECVPAALAEQVTASVEVPVIGIGAGAACDGQVLVVYDMLGIGSGKAPRFVKDFLAATPGGVREAVQAYVQAVKDGSFPAPEHTFS